METVEAVEVEVTDQMVVDTVAAEVFATAKYSKAVVVAAAMEIVAVT